MFVSQINLADFRSFKELHADFAEGLTFITGANAAGKTNLIEALYYLSLGRSFKKANDSDLIRIGQKNGQILVKYTSLKEGDHELQALISQEGKVISFDGEKQKSVLKIIGKLLCVVYSPLTVGLFRDEPGERRRFVDGVLSLMFPKYLYALSRQKKLLKQRNMALAVNYDEDVIRVLTDEICNISYSIYMARQRFCKKAEPIMDAYYKKLFLTDQTITFKYKTDVPHEDSQEVFISKLKDHFDSIRSDERTRKMTLIGVQKDDFLAYLDGKEVYAYASQGQNRLAVLALSLAVRQMMEEIFEEKPVLLLDDVLSDLDEERQKSLMAFLEDNGQVFLTSAQKPASPFKGTCYEVIDNKLERR